VTGACNVVEHDGSVVYIDDDDDDDPSIPVSFTLPYASGRVLLASVLDALVTTVSIFDLILQSITCCI